MSHTMSPSRHDTYIERRRAEKLTKTARKAQRNAKRMERSAFTR